MESIRWKFSSAFGAGAIVGLFLSSSTDASPFRFLAGLILVLGVSVAGLVTQVRIYALSVDLWRRILVLQRRENELLRELPEYASVELEEMRFPVIGIERNRALNAVTVGMVSCMVFALLIGLVAALVLHRFTAPSWVVVVVGAMVTIGLTLTSLALATRLGKVLADTSADADPTGG